MSGFLVLPGSARKESAKKNSVLLLVHVDAARSLPVGYKLLQTRPSEAAQATVRQIRVARPAAARPAAGLE